MQKKAAFEMSMTTVVIIVLAMTMLILGLTLVRTIFKGAKYNVEAINEKVRSEINKLFVQEDQRIAVYLAEQKAVIKQGEEYGVCFAIKNIEPESKVFDYKIIVDDPGTCSISEKQLKEWIIIGGKGSPNLGSGDTYVGLIRFRPPLTAPLCMARFVIDIGDYATALFDVKIKAK